MRLSRCANPWAGLGGVGRVKIANLGGERGFAGRSNGMLPALFAHHRQALHPVEMPEIELDLPLESGHIPALETGRVQQVADPAVHPGQSIEFLHEGFVVFLDRRTDAVCDQDFVTILLAQRNRHACCFLPPCWPGCRPRRVAKQFTGNRLHASDLQRTGTPGRHLRPRDAPFRGGGGLRKPKFEKISR